MSFMNTLAEALQPEQPQTPPQPKSGDADMQQEKRLAAIEAAKIKQADDTRGAALNHMLGDEDRRKLTEHRDKFVAEQKKAGKPLQHAELHIIDCQIELELATRAFDRDPGQPRILGDGNLEMSKQKSRVKAAERALKSAKDALERMNIMTSRSGAESHAIYQPVVDATGYFDHRKHITDTMAAINKK